LSFAETVELLDLIADVDGAADEDILDGVAAVLANPFDRKPGTGDVEVVVSRRQRTLLGRLVAEYDWYPEDADADDIRAAGVTIRAAYDSARSTRTTRAA
jgi:hypothetical protein